MHGGPSRKRLSIWRTIASGSLDGVRTGAIYLEMRLPKDLKRDHHQLLVGPIENLRMQMEHCNDFARAMGIDSSCETDNALRE